MIRSMVMDVERPRRVSRWMLRRFMLTLGLAVLLPACKSSEPQDSQSVASAPSGEPLEISFLVGSALGDFCKQSAERMNNSGITTTSGRPIQLKCESLGTGDVVTRLTTLVGQLKGGSLTATAPEFPTLVALDGDIYLTRLAQLVNQEFPGQKYVPEVADATLIASSPMVFMTSTSLAPGLAKQADVFKILGTATTHADIDPKSPPIKIHYVHTAPTRSNSGLQALIQQFVSVTGKRPEDITLDDVKAATAGVTVIQSHVTRYGLSTSSLAQSMVQNGTYWASVGSVYESSVVAVNAKLPPGQEKYQAIYPRSTYTSNMRAFVSDGPWVSADEKEAAKKVLGLLVSKDYQVLAANSGLRPALPGIPLGALFTPDYGVNPNATYDSLRAPSLEVVDAMLKGWVELAKKPSQVTLVVDSSGSMRGDKLPAVQRALQIYLDGIGPRDQVSLIDFDTEIREPVRVDGSPEGKAKAMGFISGLEVGGGTALYDATLKARDDLFARYDKNAINAVIVLTDGNDEHSKISLDELAKRIATESTSSDQRISFFTIGFGQDGEFDEVALQRIATANSGYYSKGNPQTITKVMADLQLEF